MRLTPAISRLLILTTLLAPFPVAGPRAAVAQDEVETSDADASGLRFRLSEVREPVEQPTPNRVAPAEPLPAAEVERLLSRLPALTPAPGDTEDFKLRERTLPPPRAGRTIGAAFAADSSAGPPPARTSAALEVLRLAPEGEVSLAPALSITFSQPMVAVGSQDEAAAHVPVKLSPQPEGKWRWLGAQTLVFEPAAEGGRFPMATRYTVNVPAGTRTKRKHERRMDTKASLRSNGVERLDHTGLANSRLSADVNGLPASHLTAAQEHCTKLLDLGNSVHEWPPLPLDS
jgi:hypothetical protein